MAKQKLCEFGKEINHALVDINQTKCWLISEVQADSGKYFDRSYLHKIETGKYQNQTMINSICKILNITRKDNE